MSNPIDTNSPLPTPISAQDFRAQLAQLDTGKDLKVVNNDITDTNITMSDFEPTDTLEPGETEEVEIKAEPDAVEAVESEIDEDLDTDKEIPNRLVNRKRLNKEIEKRQAIEAQYHKDREELIRAKTELDLINRALATMNDPKNVAAKPEQGQNLDPLDQDAHQFYVNKIEGTNNELEKIKNKLEQSERQRAFENTINKHREAFVAKNPDFDQAYTHLLNIEFEKEKLNHETEDQAKQAAEYKLFMDANKSLKLGKNVAANFYKMAEISGYKKTGANRSNRPSPDLDAINKNMKKSASVAGIPGASLSPSNGAANYTVLNNFERAMMNKSGQGVDAKKFRDTLAALKSN